MKRKVADTNSVLYKLSHNKLACFVSVHDWVYPVGHASDSHMECKVCKKRIRYDQNVETVVR